jgi:integrase
MRIKFDGKTVTRLKLPDSKNEEIYWDEELPGFGLRLRAIGDRVVRTWLLQYRSHGRTRRMKVGTFEKLTFSEARKAARENLAKVELGSDPRREKAVGRLQAARTLGAVVKSYLETKESEVRPSTFRGMRLYLNGPYFKPLHSTILSEITLADIAARLNVIKRISGSTALKARSSLSGLYVWAMGEGLVSANPVLATHKPAAAGSRDRALSLEELGAVWRACDDDDYGRIVRLLILLGSRRQEVGSMRWTEFDLAKCTWLLPKERSKNGHELLLTLPSAALKIIGSQQSDCDYLFGVNGFVCWSAGKSELDRRLTEQLKGAFRLHDLRRSFSTRMNDLGVQPHVIEAALNHYGGARSGSAGIYNKSTYSNDVRAALALWAEHVLAAAEERTSKIVILKAS